MELRTKRKLSLIAVCSYIFLGGVEYAVIFPSAWEYLQSLGVHEEYYLGLTVSAYSLSAAVAGILGGRWSDWYPNHTKTLCLFCVAVMGVGNLLYVTGIHAWNVIASRFLCGWGTGAGAALLAFVCRTTTVEERTAMLSICSACRQIGIVIGPAFQILFVNVDFHIGPLHITRLNAAGLFMAVLWLIYVAICLLTFYDITREWQEMHHIHMQTAEDDGVQLEQRPLRVTFASTSSLRTMSFCESVSVQETAVTQTYSSELMQDSVIALLWNVFAVYFGQVLIETLVPLYMKEYFGLGDIQISLMYTVNAVECLLLFVLIIWLSRFIRDWVLNLTGLVIILVGFCWLCATLPFYKPGDMSNLVPYILANILIGLGYPISNVANTALTSKCLSPEAQGIGQGMRRCMSYVALILSPLWASSTAQSPSLMLGVTLALLILQVLLYVDVLPHIMKIETDALQAAQDENTPLIDPASGPSSMKTRSWSVSSEGFSADNEESVTSSVEEIRRHH